MPSLGPASGMKPLSGIDDRGSSPNVWRRAGNPDRERRPSLTMGLPRFRAPVPHAEPITRRGRYAWE
jgi:hypothetical protein